MRFTIVSLLLLSGCLRAKVDCPPCSCPPKEQSSVNVPVTKGTTNSESGDQILKGYALAACLDAGGTKSAGIDEALSYYLEQAADPWRFEIIQSCAASFAAGATRNVLGRDLILPTCLEFVESAEFLSIKGLTEGQAAPACKRAVNPRRPSTGGKLPLLE